MNPASIIRRLVFRLSQAILLLFLPFVMLLRGGIWLQSSHQAPPWAAMAGGFLLSGTLIFIYILYLQHRVSGRMPGWNSLRWQYALVSALLMVYCIPALFTLSLSNAKTDGVREEFRSLHPVLRLGISTLIWMDPDLVLTDAERVPEDYGKMGLSVNGRSLHYLQSDGYAHAVDIRTKGRASWRNMLAVAYFRVMGFQCTRHIGTADHLHISLPPGGNRA